MPVDFSRVNAPIPETPNSQGNRFVADALDAIMARRQAKEEARLTREQAHLHAQMVNDRMREATAAQQGATEAARREQKRQFEIQEDGRGEIRDLRDVEARFRSQEAINESVKLKLRDETKAGVAWDEVERRLDEGVAARAARRRRQEPAYPPPPEEQGIEAPVTPPPALPPPRDPPDAVIKRPAAPTEPPPLKSEVMPTEPLPPEPELPAGDRSGDEPNIRARLRRVLGSDVDPDVFEEAVVIVKEGGTFEEAMDMVMARERYKPLPPGVTNQPPYPVNDPDPGGSDISGRPKKITLPPVRLPVGDVPQNYPGAQNPQDRGPQRPPLAPGAFGPPAPGEALPVAAPPSPAGPALPIAARDPAQVVAQKATAGKKPSPWDVNWGASEPAQRVKNFREAFRHRVGKGDPEMDLIVEDAAGLIGLGADWEKTYNETIAKMLDRTAALEKEARARAAAQPGVDLADFNRRSQTDARYNSALNSSVLGMYGQKINATQENLLFELEKIAGGSAENSALARMLVGRWTRLGAGVGVLTDSDIRTFFEKIKGFPGRFATSLKNMIDGTAPQMVLDEIDDAIRLLKKDSERKMMEIGEKIVAFPKTWAFSPEYNTPERIRADLEVHSKGYIPIWQAKMKKDSDDDAKITDMERQLDLEEAAAKAKGPAKRPRAVP